MEKKRSAKRSKGDVSTNAQGDEIDIDEASQGKGHQGCEVQLRMRMHEM